MRTASATWRGVASRRSGTKAPVTIPPRATIWWQPAQRSVNASLPRAIDPAAGSASGSAGSPKLPT
jgi:hypothetical protein